MTEAEQLAFIETLLIPMTKFVVWDRFAGDVGGWAVYGWIDRDDAYKDFVVVDVMWQEGTPSWWYVTSSARYSETIGELLGLDGHCKCRRAEDVFPNLRTVQL